MYLANNLIKSCMLFSLTSTASQTLRVPLASVLYVALYIALYSCKQIRCHRVRFSWGCPREFPVLVPSLVRMLARSFNDLYLILVHVKTMVLGMW